MNLFWVPLMLILVFNPEHFYQNCLGIVREVGMESIGGRQVLNSIKKYVKGEAILTSLTLGMVIHK